MRTDLLYTSSIAEGSTASWHTRFNPAVLVVAGPVFLTRIYEEHPRLFNDVMIYPSNVFYPVGDDDRKYRVLNTSRAKYQHTFAVHRWHHLWLRQENDRSGGTGSVHGLSAHGQHHNKPHNGDGQYRAVAQRREQRDLSMIGNSTHGAYLYPILFGNVSAVVNAHGNLASSTWLAQSRVRDPARYFSQLQLRGANGVSEPAASIVSSVERAVFGSSFVGIRSQQLLFNIGVAWRKGDDLADVDRPSLEDITLAVVTFPRTEFDTSAPSYNRDWFYAGSHKIGTSIDGKTKVHVTYPHSKSAAAHSVMREVLVFLQVRAQANGDSKWLDTFVASVRSTTPRHGYHDSETVETVLMLPRQEQQEQHEGEFSLNVARLDTLDNNGWAQDLRLYYLVVTDVDACQGLGSHIHTTPRRCGVATVGPSGEARFTQLSVKFSVPFPRYVDGLVQVLLQPRNDGGSTHHFDDVHSTVVTRVGVTGFEATVARVDQVGGSWGQRLEVQYLAWVAG